MKDKESPFGNCLIFASNALARETARLADLAFSEHDMSYSHAFIIMQIAQYPGMPIGDLSHGLMLSPSTITRLCQKLEKNGYLKKTNNGRITKINPTPKAEKTAVHLHRIWAEVTDKYIDQIGKEQSTKLTNKIYKAAKKLDSI